MISWRDHRDRAVAGVVTAIVGVVALVLPWPGEPLARLSFDLPVRLATPSAPQEAIIVYLDDLSHQQLDQPHHLPWDRRLHARLITNLLAHGASVVAMDILLDEAGPNPSADAELAQAIAAGGNRVLLAAEIDDRVPELRRLVQPIPSFRGPNDGNQGLINFAPDRDGIMRRHFHQEPEWKDMPSLSWRAAEVVRPALTRLAEGRGFPRWIRYYGPPGTLQQLNYFNAINPTNRSVGARLRGRAVFVGAGSGAGYTGKLLESIPTPHTGIHGRWAPGVDLHATQFLNLIRDDWLRSPSPLVQCGLIAICGLGLGFVLAGRRPLIAFGLAIPLGVLLGGAGLLAPAFGNVWFPWAVAALVQAPAALLWALAFAPVHRSVAQAVDRTSQFNPASATETTPAMRVPDHELIRRIGHGAYGEVWLARNVMGGFRAVKIVRRRTSGPDEAFDREFAGLQRIEPISRQHDGLVDILHAGRDPRGAYFYYVMELADDAGANGSPTAGIDPDRYQPRTLRRDLDETGRASVESCAQIGRALARALEFIHERSLIHRDIKPANIIFVEGRPKLADLGLITSVDAASSLVGTMGYLPPEGPGTPQADLFSVGMVLYELATGWEHRRFPEMPASLFEDAAGPALVAIILKASHPRVEERCATARALAAALDQLAASFPNPPQS